MADDDQAGIQLGFFSKSQKSDPTPLSLLGVDGHEEISRLFSFELLLYRRGEPLEDAQLAALLAEPCVVAFGSRKTDIVHGVLSSIEHVGGARDRGAYYRATLRPHASLMDRGTRSAIYQDTTAPEMIAAVLTSFGLVEDETFKLRLAQPPKSPKHEYIVQYNESDWHFIQRWLEREGFFYWFRHTTDGVVLMIADSNADATPLDEPATISFRERNNLGVGAGTETIWDLRLRQARVPSTVTLVDYNDERPMDLLIATKKIDPGGFGHVVHYGQHFDDKAIGGEWAKLRSEEHYAERRVFTGQTDCARLRSGHRFELENHAFAPYDGKYLVTSVRHQAGVDPTKDRDDFEDLGQPRAYRAKFTAIPLDVPYRPRRVTAWPRIHGVTSAHIEADTAGEFAQLDDHGRYKVKFPFDLGTNRGLASSRWIRMAQSYAGMSYGQHMPLHKGTEVLIAHVDGDPDRPLIVGAVPNPVTPSPVVASNATQSVLQTASGIRIELEDRA